MNFIDFLNAKMAGAAQCLDIESFRKLEAIRAPLVQRKNKVGNGPASPPPGQTTDHLAAAAPTTPTPNVK